MLYYDMFVEPEPSTRCSLLTSYSPTCPSFLTTHVHNFRALGFCTFIRTQRTSILFLRRLCTSIFWILLPSDLVTSPIQLLLDSTWACCVLTLCCLAADCCSPRCFLFHYCLRCLLAPSACNFESHFPASFNQRSGCVTTFGRV